MAHRRHRGADADSRHTIASRELIVEGLRGSKRSHLFNSQDVDAGLCRYDACRQALRQAAQELGWAAAVDRRGGCGVG